MLQHSPRRAAFFWEQIVFVTSRSKSMNFNKELGSHGKLVFTLFWFVIRSPPSPAGLLHL
jgi:hypothetical protein